MISVSQKMVVLATVVSAVLGASALSAQNLRLDKFQGQEFRGRDNCSVVIEAPKRNPINNRMEQRFRFWGAEFESVPAVALRYGSQFEILPVPSAAGLNRYMILDLGAGEWELHLMATPTDPQTPIEAYVYEARETAAGPLRLLGRCLRLRQKN